MKTRGILGKITQSNATFPWILNLKNQSILTKHRKVKKKATKFTSVTGNSTVCFAAGLTVISVTASVIPNSPSLLSPPYLTESCSGAM